MLVKLKICKFIYKHFLKYLTICVEQFAFNEKNCIFTENPKCYFQLKSRISDLTRLQTRANNLKSSVVYSSMEGCALVIDRFCDALTTHISAFFAQV